MSNFITMGALLQCNQGVAPAPLNVLDPTRPMIQNKPQANIMDFAPMTNIPTFGMCRCPANPQVAAATAAASGVLTPMPCIPNTVAPWQSSAQEKVANFPALLDNSKCMCMWGGQISITFPGYVAPTTG